MCHVEGVVLIQWFLNPLVYRRDVLWSDGAERGVFVHAVHAVALCVPDELEVGFLLGVVLVDEEGVGDDEYSMSDVLPEVFGDECDELVE